MTTPKKPRGRPPVPPDQAQTEIIRERVTPAEKTKYVALGGKAWLRPALKRAKPKKEQP